MKKLSEFKSIEWIKSKIDWRVLGCIFLIGFLFDFDLTTIQVVGFSLGFLFCHALASHVLRKMLFPYLDMKKFFEKSVTTPLGASISILGVCIVLATLINSASIMWKNTGG